jgi:hypothetical protein
MATEVTMPLYTFNLCKADSRSVTFEFHDLPTDRDAFELAGKLLDEHFSSDHVEVWDDERPVAGRHRVQPVIRPVASIGAHAS